MPQSFPSRRYETSDGLVKSSRLKSLCCWTYLSNAMTEPCLMSCCAHEKCTYIRSGALPPAICARYFLRKSPQGVFSALTTMLGWRFMNCWSNCCWRGQKEASQAWATLIVTFEDGSEMALFGHGPPAPSDSEYNAPPVA